MTPGTALERLWWSFRRMFLGATPHRALVEILGSGLVWTAGDHTVHFEAPEGGWPLELRGGIHPPLLASYAINKSKPGDSPGRVARTRPDGTHVLLGRGYAIALAEARGVTSAARDAELVPGELVGRGRIRVVVPDRGEPEQAIRDRLAALVPLIGALGEAGDPAAVLQGAPPPQDPAAWHRRVAALHDLGNPGRAADELPRLVASGRREHVALALRLDPKTWTPLLSAELEAGKTSPARHHALALALASLERPAELNVQWRKALRRGAARDRVELAAILLRADPAALRSTALDVLTDALPHCSKNDSRGPISDALDALPRRRRYQLIRRLLPHLGALHRTLAGEVAGQGAALGPSDALVDAVLRSTTERDGPLHPHVTASLIARHPNDPGFDRALAARLVGAAPRVQLAAAGRLEHADPELADALRGLLHRRGVGKAVRARIREQLQERGHRGGTLAVVGEGGDLALTGGGGDLAIED